MENQKQTSIKSIIPLRILGLHRDKPFQYPISDTHVVYLSQFHLILQKLSDHSQTIVWSVPQFAQQNQIEIITGQTDVYQITKIIIVVKNQRLLSKIVKILMIDQNAGVIGQNYSQVRDLDYYEQIKAVRYVSEIKTIIFLIQLKKSRMCKILLLTVQGVTFHFRQELVLLQRIEWIHPFELQKSNFLMLVTKLDIQMVNLQKMHIIFRKNFGMSSLTQEWASEQVDDIKNLHSSNNKSLGFDDENYENQQKQVIIYSQINQSYKENSIGILVSNLGYAYSYQPNINPQKIIFNRIDISIEDEHSRKNKTRQINNKKVYQENSKILYKPKSVSSIANKVLILYQNSATIGYLTFSVHDCSKYTFKCKKIQTPCKQNGKYYQNVKFANDQCHCCLIQTSKNKQSIIFIDIISAFLSVSSSLKLKQKQIQKCIDFQYNSGQKNKKGQRKIILSQVSLFSNFLFTVDKDHILSAFKLDIKKGFMNLCWCLNIYGEPYSISCHPTVYKIVIIFPQRLHCYSYNEQNAIPYYISSGTKFTSGCYSLLGNYLALGGYESLKLYDAYSWDIYREQVIKIKTVTKIKFLNLRGDALIQLNGNSLFLMYDKGPLVNLGNPAVQLSQKPYIYDIYHKLVLYQDYHDGLLKIVNDKLLNIGQLEQPIKDTVTCLVYFAEIQSMVLGTQKGYIQVIDWGTKRINFQIILNVKVQTSAIIMITASLDLQYLISLSQEGNLCVSKVKYTDCTKLKHNVSGNLLRKNQMRTYQFPFLMLKAQNLSQKNQQIGKLKLALQQSKDNRTNQVQFQEKILEQQYKTEQQQFLSGKNETELYPKKYSQMILSIQRQIINLSKTFENSKREIQQKGNQQIRKIYQERGLLQQELKKRQKQRSQILINRAKQNSQIQQSMLMKFQTLYGQNQRQFNQIYGAEKYKQHLNQSEQSDFCKNQKEKIINYNSVLLDQLNKQLSQLKQSNKHYLNENRHLVVNNNFLWNKNRELVLRINDFELEQGQIVSQFNNVKQQRQTTYQILQGKNQSFKQLQYRTVHMEGKVQKITQDVKNTKYIHDYKNQEYQKIQEKGKHYQKLCAQIDQQFIQKTEERKIIENQITIRREKHKYLCAKIKNLKLQIFIQSHKLQLQDKMRQKSSHSILKQSSFYSNKNSPKMQKGVRLNSNNKEEKIISSPVGKSDKVVQLFESKQKSVQKLIKSNNAKKAFRKQYELFIKKTNDQTNRLYDHLNRIRKQNLELSIKMKNLMVQINQAKQNQEGTNRAMSRKQNDKSSIGQFQQQRENQRQGSYIRKGSSKGSCILSRSNVFNNEKLNQIKKSRTFYKCSQTDKKAVQNYKTPLSKYRKRNEVIKIKSKGSTYISLHQSADSSHFVAQS